MITADEKTETTPASPVLAIRKVFLFCRWSFRFLFIATKRDVDWIKARCAACSGTGGLAVPMKQES